MALSFGIKEKLCLICVGTNSKILYDEVQHTRNIKVLLLLKNFRRLSSFSVNISTKLFHCFICSHSFYRAQKIYSRSLSGDVIKRSFNSLMKSNKAGKYSFVPCSEMRIKCFLSVINIFQDSIFFFLNDFDLTS